MTKVNLKVKIHMVDALFVGKEYLTEVWLSRKVAREIARWSRDIEGPRFAAKLKHYATAGFRYFEFAKGPIRYEWAGVYRIGHKARLFRIIGFYETNERTVFVGMDAFTKSGTELSKSQRDRIDEVAKIKKDGRWKKKAGK